MYFTAREQEKLLIVVAADLARRRKARGLKLNYPEALSILCAEILEAARDGKSVAETCLYGHSILRGEDLIDGVAEMLHEVQIEATFPDGTRLVTLYDPVGKSPSDQTMGTILANDGRPTTDVEVRNTGDRPVQIGSHFPFFSSNRALAFDREKTRDMRLDIPAGAAVRFKPGEVKKVTLVPFGGRGLKPYPKVQFIAHAINTGPKIVGNKLQYMGLDSPAADIEERIKLVGKVIETVRSRPETLQGDSGVLKLFMMPEFFFRGKTGAYGMDDVQLVVSRLHDLVKSVAAWQHWVFVFGTIVGHSLQAAVDKDVEVYNYALVQRGGFGDTPGAGPSAANAVVKEFLSSIDFIQKQRANGGIYLERVQHLAAYQPSWTASEVQVTDYDGSAVFHVGALTVGLEVCLDHAQGRLKQSKNLPLVNLQLVPSCGMNIKEGSIVAKDGGYIFLCDGLNSYDDRNLPYNSRVKKIGKGEIGPIADFNVNAGEIKIDQLYPSGAGNLRIYPPQDLTQG